MNFTPWQRALLRFALVFFPLFIVLNTNGFLPKIDDLYNWYILPFHVFIPWVGSHILHLSYPIVNFTYGSGDTTYDYLMLAMVFLIALLAAAIWSLLERSGKRDYYTAWRWLLIIIRYYLAFSLFEYGFAKLFYLQFTPPSLGRLQQSFGNASPMGLAWTFFGYSKAYNYFTGGAELLAGLLLIFRRTTRIGALLAFIVMLNVMMINYCYDVCVKLMSTQLTIMALILMIRDWRPHCHFLLVNRAADPDEEKEPRFKNKKLDRTMRILKWLVIAYALVGNIWQNGIYLKEYSGYDHPPLAGIYDVNVFIKNRDTLAPLQTDTLRWRKLIVSYAGRASVKMMNDSLKRYNFLPDTIAHKLTLYSDDDTIHKYSFIYTQPTKDSLVLKGKWLHDSCLISFRRFDEKSFILMTRGFHFINETPFNR